MHCMRSLKSFVRNSCFSLSWTNSNESSSTFWWFCFSKLHSIAILFGNIHLFPDCDINSACGNAVAAISVQASVGVSIRASIRSRPWGCIFWFCLGISSLDVSSDFAWAFPRWMCHLFLIMPNVHYAYSLWIFYHRLLWLKWTLYVRIVQYIHAKYWMQWVLYFLQFVFFLGQRLWSSDASCRCLFLFGSFQTMFQSKYMY